MLDNIARHNVNRFVVPIGMDTSVFNAQARPNAPGTFLQQKVTFPMSKKNQYPFETVSFHAYRKILTDIVSHYSKGETNADFNFSLYDCLKPAFLQDLITKWRAQVNAAESHPHRKDGGYIYTYGRYDLVNMASVPPTQLIYIMYYALMPLRREGTEPQSLMPTVQRMVADEWQHFVTSNSLYMSGNYRTLNYLEHFTAITKAWFLCLAEIRRC